MHPRASWWRHLDSTAAGAAGRMERQEKYTLKVNTDVSFPFCIFKYFVGSRGAAVSGAHHVCSQEGGF